MFMTEEPLLRTAWPWTDPLWWTGRQFEAMTAVTTLMTRLMEAVLEASVSSLRIAVTAPAVGETATAMAAATPRRQPEAAEQVEEPPVPQWDELSLGSIRGRLRRFSEDDLVALCGYEERHGCRPAILAMLGNRLAKVRQATTAPGVAPL
jgi:hypothetical protein